MRRKVTGLFFFVEAIQFGYYRRFVQPVARPERFAEHVVGFRPGPVVAELRLIRGSSHRDQIRSFPRSTLRGLQATGLLIPLWSRSLLYRTRKINGFFAYRGAMPRALRQRFGHNPHISDRGPAPLPAFR